MIVEFAAGDIAGQRVDAIVNAANTQLLGGGGVDGAIHRAAGPALLAECQTLRDTTLPDGLPVGDAVATGAGQLHARWVIHTVGPVFTAGDDKAQLLAACFAHSLRLADSLGAKSVAMPAISTGVYGWPLDDCARIARRTIDALDTEIDVVRFVIFEPERCSRFQSAYEAS